VLRAPAILAATLAFGGIATAPIVASAATKRCPAGYKKVGRHCTRAIGAPPRGFADTYQGTRGTLRVSNRAGSLSARLSWRVTLVCSDGSKLPSARGIEEAVRVGRDRKLSMSVPSTLGTATFAAGWRNRNAVSGTLTITGYPGRGESITCAGSFAGSFAFKRRVQL
jgi:hypothetical protein